MKIVSYGGHSFGTDYSAVLREGSAIRLPAARVLLAERSGAWPLVAGLQRPGERKILSLHIDDSSDILALRTQLFQWFDPESEAVQPLVAEDDDGDNDRYLECLCESLVPYGSGDSISPDLFIATLAVHGDVRWRASTEDDDEWSITASGQTHAIDNEGEDEAYPIYTIEPTTAKGSSYVYRRWIPVAWLSTNGKQQYPVMAALDTAALVTAGKMLSNGNDLRVLVDGTEVYRWLDGMNTSDTHIWFSPDFSGVTPTQLKTAIAGSGDVDSIELVQDISGWPDSGVCYIGTEAFVYSARNVTERSLSGIERAAKGTSAGAHSIGDRVHWIQHDIYVVYGNSAASAPTVDDQYKPAFELDQSSNESWVYEVFSEMGYEDWGDTGMMTGEHRAARWDHMGNLVIAGGNGGVYTATERGWSFTYDVAGAWITSGAGQAYGWTLYNPCGITNVTWADGLKRRATTNPPFDFLAHLMYWQRSQSWWSWQDTPASPTVINTWEEWSSGPAEDDFDPVADTIGIALYFFPADIEVGTVTVDLNDSETPVVAVGAEQGNYHLQATLTNTTTGEAIALDFVMDVNSSLEVDTYNKTVTWLKDGSRQFQALTTCGTRTTSLAKRAWLRLLPGSNTLRFDDTGTGHVTLTTTFSKRYY